MREGRIRELSDIAGEIGKKAANYLFPFRNDRKRKSEILVDAIIAATTVHIGKDINTANLNHFQDFKIQGINITGH